MSERTPRLANQVIRRIRWGFTPRQQDRSPRGDQGHDLFVTLGLSLENPLQLHGVDIQPVQEWPLAIRRGARSDQENEIAVLQYCLVPIRQRPKHWRPRIVILVLRTQVPNERLFVRLVRMKSPRFRWHRLRIEKPSPATQRVPVKISQDRKITSLSERDPCKSLLRSR